MPPLPTPRPPTILERLFGDDSRLDRKLDLILDTVQRMEKQIMGQLEDLVKQLDTETNNVATKLDKLSQDLKQAVDSGQAPTQETLTGLQAISDRLRSLGQDTNQPIPPATDSTTTDPNASQTSTDPNAPQTATDPNAPPVTDPNAP